MKIIEEMYFLIFLPTHGKTIFAFAQLNEANHGHKKAIKNQSVNGTFGFSNTQAKAKNQKSHFFTNVIALNELFLSHLMRWD